MPKIPITKIIATLGPASSSETVIRKMILAGMDVARFNFSHGDIGAHQRRLDTVRKINRKYRRKIKILQDLEGNRIRVGKLKDGKPIELKKRQKIAMSHMLQKDGWAEHLQILKQFPKFSRLWALLPRS